jgi:hypothetical protein
LVKLSGKQNTVKRYTPNSATLIGANTMFPQIGKRYTPFSFLHFFPILPIISAQVLAKRFMRNTRWGVPQYGSITQGLTPLSTQLSFRWTIPLRGVSHERINLNFATP